MKYTCKTRRRTALRCIYTLSATIAATCAFGNPFNNGTTNSIVADTAYNETLYVGIQNPDNTLLIDSNATVSATDLVIGQLTSSTNNTVSVIGDSRLIAGDATTNGLATGGIVVGEADAGSAINVNNGSTLNAEFLYVGFGTNDSGKISLAGDGTELNIAQDAFVGYAGSTNSVEIGDGAAFNVNGALTVGSLSGTNNHVNVSSGGTLFVNSTNDINVVGTDAKNGIVIKGNGTLQVGGDVNTGTLDDLGVDMQSSANLELGGTLQLDKNKIDSHLNIILNGDLSTNTATWSSSSLTAIGATTINNSLTFTNGATGHALNIVQIGQGTAANGNELNVGGSNSLFTADTDVFVGAQGKNNQLNVADGGQVDVAGNLYLGNNASATGNQANINSNGTLNVTGDIVVGDNGANNALNIDGGSLNASANLVLGNNSGNNRYNLTNGSNTVDGAFIIGNAEDATGKTGFVDNDRVETTGNLAIIGTNAILNIGQDLTVGQEGGGSIMAIRDGGAVNVDGDVVIGEAVGDNYIYLQRDSNTLFNVTGDLVVGVEGGSNRFAEYGGTANVGGDLYLGASTNQHDIKNFIHLETSNAVLNVANAFYVGASNSLNTVDIVDGATANTKDLFVGTYEGVSNNVVTVKGDEAMLVVANMLGIGSTTGSDNTVIIQDGGILNVAQTNIVISGTNNTLNIANGGILQTIDWDASISDENIVMDSGATLELGGSYTGTNRLDGSFELRLNGSLATNNAAWDAGSETLFVGYKANGNTLTAKDGGKVATTTNLIVGRSSSSTGNTLNSTGQGSLIDVGNNLIVGNSGSSKNKLVLEEGGQATVGNSFVLGSKSASNTATLSGLTNAVSTLSVNNALTIGSGTDATGNTLTISSNATVNIYGAATIGSGTDNNTLKLAGTNAMLNAYSSLVVGSGTASGNELAISEGTATIAGDLIVGNNEASTGNSVTVSGSNATLHALSDLYVGKEGSENTLDLSNGALFDALNVFIGYGTNSHDNAVTVFGSNTTFNVSSNLYAGYKGNNNSLSVSNGAIFEANNVYVGYSSSNNWIEVSGSNTAFSILNDLFVGTETNLSGQNIFYLNDQSHLSVGNDLSLSKGALYIDAGSQATVGGNYSQDEFSILGLRISTNYVTTNLVVGNTASFAKNTTFQLFDDKTVVGTTNNVEHALVSAGSLKIDDQAATQDLLNDDIVIGNDLLDFNLILSNNVIWIDNVTRVSLGSASGLAPGSQLAKVADEIDAMADGSNVLASTMRDFMDTQLDAKGRNQAWDNYYGKKMSSLPAHNAINMGLQSVTEQLTKRADNTRARLGAASSSINTPSGAQGPHAEKQELQGWITGFKTWADRSADSGFDGYDGHIGGFLLGGDLEVTEGILAGVAGGSASSTMDKDNGASVDTTTTFGTLYGSAGTKDWFADASFIYGSSSVDASLGSTFNTDASYDAHNVAVYIGGGKEITGNYLIITPQASLLGNYYKQDSYVESSSTAVPRKVDSFNTVYVQSAIGCNVGFYSTVGDTTIKPEFRAFWLHEFNAREEDVSYSLVGGTGSYNVQMQAPESDIFKLGGGISTKMGEYLEIRADLDARMASSYSDYTLLGSIRYQF